MPSVIFALIYLIYSTNAQLSNDSYFEPAHPEKVEFLSENHRLYFDLFKNYNRDLAAVYTKRNFTDVHSVLIKENYNIPRDPIVIALTYAKLLDVDSAKSMMTLIVEYSMYWRDIRFLWNPEDYGGIDHIYVLRKRVWVPEVTPFDSMEVQEARPDFKQFVTITSQGFVNHYVSLVVTSNCQMNIMDFPFDSQNCSIKLLSYTFTVGEIEINSTVYPTIVPQNVGNQEWQVLNVTAESEIIDVDTSPTQINQFTFEMKRNPSYYVVLIIVPSFILSFICIAGLFTSPLKTDDIDKIAMGLTTIMSSVLMISVLSQSIPKTKKSPKISDYVTGNLIIVSVAIVVAILVPKVGQMFMLIYRFCFRKIQQKRGIAPSDRTEKHCVKRFNWLFKGILTTAILFFFEAIVVINAVVLMMNENVKDSLGMKKK